MMGLKFRPPNLVVGADRFKAMDEQGIDMEAISINPFWYHAERDIAPKRDQAAEREARRDRARRIPTASSPSPRSRCSTPTSPCSSSKHGVKKLGLRGMSVGGSVEGMELADPKFHPFWAKAEELGVLVFIHPQSARTELAPRCRATAGSRTPSAIRSRPRSRCRT